MLRIATFNINGIRSRLPALLAWLQREAPDIVCLQELKAVDRNFPSRRSPRPATARSGKASPPGTASPSWPGHDAPGDPP